MNIVLDLAVIAVIVLLIVGGYRRGLIKTVVELIGTVVSSLIASVGGSLLSVSLYDAFLKERIIKAAADAMPEVTPTMHTSDISKHMLDQVPAYIKNSLEIAGVDVHSLNQEIERSVKEVPVMIETMVRPIVLKVFTVLISIALFVIIAAIFSLITKSLITATNLVGLSTANKVFGALIGMVEALMLIIVLSMVLSTLTVLLPIEQAQGLRDAIDSTFLYKIVYYINFPDMIINNLLHLPG